VTALVGALETEATVASGFATAVEIMRLQQLVDFQVLIKHDFSSGECKNINLTRADLLFKVAETDGSVTEKRVEVSLEELNLFRQELRRVEETLS